nr:hypothetical protein BaRGS_016915 [Batillaria attramentaria]
MGGCLCVEQSVQNRLIPDVEQIIADRVWTEFVASSHRFKSLFMRRRDYKIEVPMNFYHFEELSQTLHPMDHLQVINNAASKAMTHASSNLEGKQLAHQDKTSPEDNRLQTTFCNDTDKDQTYSFKFEKTRKASITITQHKGFSFGGKASFSVDLAKMPGNGEDVNAGGTG